MENLCQVPYIPVKSSKLPSLQSIRLSTSTNAARSHNLSLPLIGRDIPDPWRTARFNLQGSSPTEESKSVKDGSKKSPRRYSEIQGENAH
jgi:hypothetical protein